MHQIDIEELYVLNAGAIIEIEADNVSICIPAFCRRLRSSRQLMSLLECFRAPNTIRSTQSICDDPSVTQLLVDNWVIIPNVSAHALERGLLHEYSKMSSLLGLQTALISHQSGFAVFGAPIDTTIGYAISPKGGPPAVRRALSELEPFESDGGEAPFIDLGDVIYAPFAESVELVGDRIRYLVNFLIEKRMRPIFLGGDHSLSYFSILGAIDNVGSIGLIHFDAHSDWDSKPTSELSNLCHANFLAFTMREQGISRVVQFGVRDSQSSEFLDERITRVDIHKVRSNMEKLLDYFADAETTSWYLTIDIDVVDPVFAPEVVAPIPGGLTGDELEVFVACLFERLNIIAFDFVEVCGVQSKTNNAASIVARCIKRLSSVLSKK